MSNLPAIAQLSAKGLQAVARFVDADPLDQTTAISRLFYSDRTCEVLAILDRYGEELTLGTEREAARQAAAEIRADLARQW